MVEDQIAARGMRSKAVLGTLRKIPREAFLPERLREFAYEDSPRSTAAGQTVAQPFTVALIIYRLKQSKKCANPASPSAPQAASSTDA